MAKPKKYEKTLYIRITKELKERIEIEANKESARQKSIKAELDWVRSQPKARQAKNKARLARFEELNSSEFQTRNETQELYIPPGDRLGDKVLEVENLSKSFGEKILIENFTDDDLGTLYGAAELIFRGWPNEALPFSTKKKSIISSFFDRFFS